MMMKTMTLALLSLVAGAAASEPLNLSPFARDNDILGALKASEVHLPNDPLNLTSYSGFVETTPGAFASIPSLSCGVDRVRTGTKRRVADAHVGCC